MVFKAGQEVAIADVQRQVVAVTSGETVPFNSPVVESQSNGRGERSSESAGLDQNAERRIGEKIEHENQDKRPDIPVDG